MVIDFSCLRSNVVSMKRWTSMNFQKKKRQTSFVNLKSSTRHKRRECTLQTRPQHWIWEEQWQAFHWRWIWMTRNKLCLLLMSDNFSVWELCWAYWMPCIAFITHGRVNDTMVPSWIETDNTLPFISEAFSMSPADVTQKFETWSIIIRGGMDSITLLLRNTHEKSTRF